MDDGGSADSGGGGGTSTTTVAVVAIVCVLAAMAAAAAGYCCWRRRRRRRRRRLEEAEAAAAGDMVDGGQNVNKIHTLGKEYRLSSVDYSGASSARKMSLLQDLRAEEAAAAAAAAEAAEAAAEGTEKKTTRPNGAPRQPILEECEADAASAPTPPQPHPPPSSSPSSRLAPPPPPSAWESGHLGQKDRSDSTYLDYPELVSDARRKSSATSHHFTMQEIIKRTTGEAGAAPLARHDSLHSLSASKDSGLDKAGGVANHDGVSAASGEGSSSRGKSLLLVPPSPGGKGPRPQSEYNSESARFVPKLPPKKKRILQHKSAAAINLGEQQEQQQQQQHLQQHLQQPRQRLASSRSETCITELLDMDYDELPEDRQPILPPKTKPLLPPKQMINKSQDDLARIESQLRTSLSELQTRAAQEEDYDDLPEEGDVEEEEEGTEEKRNHVRPQSSHHHQNHEFQDYDDPVVHVIAPDDEDYDDPPSRHFQQEDGEDYDDPPVRHFA